MSKSFLWLAAALVSLALAWRIPPVTDDLASVAGRWEDQLAEKIRLAESEYHEVYTAVAAGADWPDTKTAFYVADSSGLVRWNTFWITPAFSPSVQAHFSLTSSRRGDFLVWHHPLEGRSLDAVIPLITVGAGSEKVWLEGSDIAVHAAGIPGSEPVRIGGREVFWITRSAPSVRYASMWAWALLFLSVAGAVMAIRIWWSAFRNPWWILVAVALVLTGYRWFMTSSGLFPGSRPGNDLFDPARFASSPFQDSAGNFLINVCCVFVFVLMVHRRTLRSLNRLRIRPEKNFVFAWLVPFLAMVLMLLVFPAQQLLMSVVYRHSQVTLDFTNSLQTDALRLVLVVAVMCGMVAAFLTIRSLWRWTVAQMFFTGYQFWWLLVSSSAVAFLSSAGVSPDYLLSWGIGVITVILLRAGTFWRHRFLMAGRRVSADYFLIVVLALSAAWNIRSYESERVHDRLTQIQDELDSDRDEFGTFLLATSADSILKDPFLRFAVDNPAGDKRLVLNRLESNFAKGYFSDYDFSAGIFADDGSVYAGWLNEPLDDLLRDFRVGQLTDTLFRIGFIRPLNDERFRKRFFAVVPVGNRLRANLVVLLEKGVSGDGVSRNDPMEWRVSTSGISGAALWRGDILKYSTGFFDYQGLMPFGTLPGPESAGHGFTFAGARHLVSFPGQDETLVLSGELYRTSRFMTMFSLLALVGFLFLLIPVLVRSLRDTFAGKSFSYASRIRWYLFTAFVLPLAALAATALFSLDNSTREKSRLLRREMALRLSMAIGKIWDDGGHQTDIRRAVLREAATAGTEVALYASDGTILFTSKPSLLADGWLAPRVGYPVLETLRRGASYTEHREKTGAASYLSSYTASRSGIIIGLPDFGYSREIEKDAITGLAVVVPVAVIIFLLFLIFSEAMTLRLTSPLRDVSIALRRTSLAGVNPPLASTGTDEMGEMIRSYNEMLGKLEQSRRELADRERESVWREMARRVAHEIRNPLTPIRLAIQRLQMQLSSGTLKPEAAREALDGILHQSQILNDIATSFSTLAHQHPLTPSLVRLAEAVRHSVAVFAGSPEGSVEVADIPEDMLVIIDRAFLSRAISNLILNSFQSSDEPVVVRISAEQEGTQVVMRVEDNGPGISPQIIDKIFDPYFTTRKTGTGLGLTLVRQGLEECGGSIEVTSSHEHGTVFRLWLRRA